VRISWTVTDDSLIQRMLPMDDRRRSDVPEGTSCMWARPDGSDGLLQQGPLAEQGDREGVERVPWRSVVVGAESHSTRIS
jgi:hypothetical protein